MCGVGWVVGGARSAIMKQHVQAIECERTNQADMSRNMKINQRAPEKKRARTRAQTRREAREREGKLWDTKK